MVDGEDDVAGGKAEFVKAAGDEDEDGNGGEFEIGKMGASLLEALRCFKRKTPCSWGARRLGMSLRG